MLLLHIFSRVQGELAFLGFPRDGIQNQFIEWHYVNRIRAVHSGGWPATSEMMLHIIEITIEISFDSSSFR